MENQAGEDKGAMSPVLTLLMGLGIVAIAVRELFVETSWTITACLGLALWTLFGVLSIYGSIVGIVDEVRKRRSKNP